MNSLPNMTTTSPIKGSCHCGNISFEVPHKPKEICECKCTLCRRYGVAWAYYNPDQVKLTLKPNASTNAYVWGDKELKFHFCTNCGCITQWKTIKKSDKMVINTNLMHPEQIKYISRRISFDVTRSSLKSEDCAHPEDQAQYWSQSTDWIVVASPFVGHNQKLIWSICTTSIAQTNNVNFRYNS